MPNMENLLDDLRKRVAAFTDQTDSTGVLEPAAMSQAAPCCGTLRCPRLADEGVRLVEGLPAIGSIR